MISVCCAAQPGGFQEDSNRQVIFIFDRKIYIHFLKRLKRLGHEIDWNLTCMDTGQIGLVRVAICFFNFSNASPSEKFFLYFLQLIGTSPRLIILLACIWPKFFCFLLVRAAGSCFSLARGICNYMPAYLINLSFGLGGNYSILHV